MPKDEKQKTLSTDDSTAEVDSDVTDVDQIKSKKSKKGILVSLALLALIIAAISGYNVLQNRSSSDSANSAAQSRNIDPANFFKTNCYSFNMPAPHDPIPTDGLCDALGQTYGEKKNNTFSVIPVAEGENLDGVKKYWYDTHPDIEVFSEIPLQLDGTDAIKIIFRATKGDDTKDHIAVIAAIKDKDYSNLGVKLHGFILAGSYDKSRPESITGFDQIVSSWKWEGVKAKPEGF